jgi:hypothetical protein
LKTERKPGVAVRVTTVIVLKVPEQFVPQLIVPGLEVTVPLPSPRGPDVFRTVRTAITVKLLALVAVPAAVVNVTRPVVAPVGTIAWTDVDETFATFVELTPLNFTAVVPLRFTPVMVTAVPGAPFAGEKLAMAGAPTKFVALVAVPPAVVTLNGPVATFAGAVA